MRDIIDDFREMSRIFLAFFADLCYNVRMFSNESMNINAQGHLTFGGADCVELAEEFHTPLYVFDEAHIRTMMRTYRQALEDFYEGNGRILYASKAFCTSAMFRIAEEEGLGADVVSGGELFTALHAGFPADRLCMHGNNKLPGEISAALEAGVSRIVIDAFSEMDLLEEEAARRGMVQNVLLRINPGVEAHTHAYVQTATPDSKFGFSVANGEADRAVRELKAHPHLAFRGLHCHIGSQIFEKQSFVLAAEKCVAFMGHIREQYGLVCDELDLGGGFGIRYTKADPALTASDYRAFLEALCVSVKKNCRALDLKTPFLYLEPGRSIVGEAGITLYTVGAIKEIPGIRKYLAIDGGMFDNPRYCLYGSQYTAVLVSRAAESPVEKVAIAGKCCESGDLIGVDFDLPAAEQGDVLAILSTGAYNYSMASNYNRNLIPPVVLVREGKAELIVRPQTYDDLVSHDVIPPRLGRE